MLADDSVTAQNMGRKILADAGYEVITVNNGSAALKRIAEAKPDLIVLDVYMPGYSGLEVCQRLKEANETARIPILLTVGKLEPFKPEEARRVRAEAFIVKPFEASELLSALTKLEDKIVPRADSSKPGRFARAIAAVEEGRYDKSVATDEDSGWRSRISFPRKKKEKAVEPEDGDDPAIYNAVNRDLKTVVEHQPPHAPQPLPQQAAPAPPVAPPVAQEDAHVDLGALVAHGLPKDVTPEEIAALAAAAAQVQGVTQSKNPEPVTGSPVHTQEIPQPEIPRPEEVSSFSAAAIAPVDEIRAQSVASEPSPAPAASAPAPETAGMPIVAETKSEDEPVSKPEAQEIASEPAASTEKISSEVAAANSAATLASEQLVSEELKSETLNRTEESAHAKSSDAASQESEDAVPAIASFATAADDSLNSDHYISAPPEPSRSEPEPVTIAAASAAAEAPAASRWTAVAVSLAPEETSISLEEEMRKAQASAPAASSTPAPVPVEVAPDNLQPEIAAEAPVVDTATAVPTPEPVSEAPAPSPVPEPVSPAIEDVPVAAESVSPVVKEFETVTPREPEPSPVVAESALEPPTPAAPVEACAAEIPAAVSSNDEVSAAETGVAQPADAAARVEPAVEAAPATSFTQPEVATDEPAAQPEPVPEVVASAPAFTETPAPETIQAEASPEVPVAEAPESHLSQESVEPASTAVTKETSGGLSDMAKKESEIAATTAAAWASWRRIRENADGKSVEHADRESDTPRDEAARAVAAGAEKAPEEASGESEVTPEIANIVDSVLADLRPKIVEEISRKLGKKKK